MNRDAIRYHISELLKVIEPNTEREGLIDTPDRVAKAWETWFGGYEKDAKEILKAQFSDGSDNYDQMVSVVNIPVYSHCEHHLAPIIGTATVAYIPNKRIVGLSKLNRLVDMYARRLQVQERLTVNIADAIEEHLQPEGIGVELRCRHMCMESRGVSQQGHYTVTRAFRGILMEDQAAREEFLNLDK